MTRRKDRSDPAGRLAKVLMDSLIAAWAEHNPRHDNADFIAVKTLGQMGYVHVAREMIKRGILPPRETG